MLWILVPIVILVFYFFLRDSEAKNLPPGPPPLPIIGNAHQTNFPNIFEGFDQWKREYGDIVSAKFFNKRMVLLNSYEVLKEALIKHGDNFSARPLLEVMFAFTDGEARGYVGIHGPVWRDHRRHALHVLRDFGLGRSFQEEKIEIEIEDLFREFDRRLDAENGNTNPILPIKYAVVNIISNMLFGFRFDYDDDRFVKLQEMLQQNINQLFKVLPFEFIPGFARIRDIMPYVFPQIRRNITEFKDFFKVEIDKHKATYEEDLENNSGKNSDFTYAYITEMRKRQREDPKSFFNDVQLVWGLFDLFAAGFETTATSLSWFFVYMAHYPEVQQKMYEEMRGLAEGIPSYGDRARYPYTNAVIAELQRCANILPIAVMHSCFEDDTLSGYNVPARSFVVANLWSILRDPQLFPNPYKFDPDRFMGGKNGDENNIDNVIAFSIGKRSCLGEGLARMELFMFTTAIVWTYKVEMPESGDNPRLDDAILSFTRAPLPFNVNMTKR